MDRKALGRGIGALIPEKIAEKEEKIVFLPIDKVKPNPLQPRENFDTEGMEDLMHSIKEKGVIQPVLVRRRGEFFELIAGERRFRAVSSLSIPEIPAIVKDVDDQDSLELSLIENIQRQSLNPIEEARAYQYLIDKYQLTQEQVSDVLGKSRAAVTNTLRLLKLPIEIQDELKRGRISFAHGKALLEIEDANKQRRLAQEIISNSLSVRELENVLKSHKPRISKTHKAGVVDPQIAAWEEALQHALATKVKIARKKKRGHIHIEFFSEEDLERIITKIRGA